MATMSSTGLATNGLDVKNIITKLVALEQKPLNALRVQATTISTKISAFGQIKSLVSTLSDAASKLSSLTGWNTVSTKSSDSKYVSASAVGGTLPNNFSVEVQSLAKAQATASAALLPVGKAVGAGTLRLESGQWNKDPASFTPGAGASVDIGIVASDTLNDVASKINGSQAGVTASVLKDASGERLLLRSRSTGLESGFRLSVMEERSTDIASARNTDGYGLSRLVAGSTVTQAAANAKATINGIAVSSATNTFAETISGITLKAEQVTTEPIEVNVSKDKSVAQKNVDEFVAAYNAINRILQETTKYDAATKSAGLFQGDSTAVGLQNSLRSAMQSLTNGKEGFKRLADVGITLQRLGDLSVNSTKFTKALNENFEAVKNLFRSSESGAATGVAVRVKALATNLLGNDGFFKSKDDTLQLSLKRNAKDQASVNDKVEAFEKRLTARYTALDKQMAAYNNLNAYLAKQPWNKK